MCDHKNRESAMEIVERDSSGRPTVWCDPCLYSLIKALNIYGIRTVASCCGHGRRPGNIVLEDGRELIIAPNFDAARQIDKYFPDICG